MVFEAEKQADMAKNIYQEHVKKAEAHRSQMMNVKESHLDFLKNFKHDDSDKPE